MHDSFMLLHVLRLKSSIDESLHDKSISYMKSYTYYSDISVARYSCTIMKVVEVNVIDFIRIQHRRKLVNYVYTDSR